MSRCTHALGVVLCLTTIAAGAEPGWHTMKATALACRDRADFERIMSIRISGDQVALNKALADAVYSNRCTSFHRGDAVYIEDVAMFSGVAKVRRRGETAAYWIDYGLMD